MTHKMVKLYKKSKRNKIKSYFDTVKDDRFKPISTLSKKK